MPDQPQSTTPTANPTTNNRPFYQPADTPPQPLWREYWYVSLMVVAFIVLAISYIIRSFLPTPPPPNQSNTWSGITPGYSTIDQAVQQLGPPISAQETNRGVETSFESFNKYRYNTVVSDQSGIVRFAKERIAHDPKHTLNQYTEQYGQPDFDLYDTTLGNSVKAFVFLEQGLVIIAHIQDSSVEQKWYFEPTDQTTFLNSWGASLDSEPEGPELLIP